MALKKITEVELLEKVPEGANTYVEIDGKFRRAPFPKGGGGGGEDISAKTEKKLLEYDGTNITLKGVVQTYRKIYDYCMLTPDFVVLVYNERAYHVNRVTSEQVVFITAYVSNGYTQIDRISINADNVVTTTSSKSEMVVNKVGTITDDNKDSTDKYPSVKAVSDVADTIKADYNQLNGRVTTLENEPKVPEDLVQKVDHTADKLDALWKLNEGQTYDFVEQTEEGVNASPSGAKYMSMLEVDGKTEQESTNGYQLLPLMDVNTTVGGITVETIKNGIFIEGYHIYGTATTTVAIDLIPLKTYEKFDTELWIAGISGATEDTYMYAVRNSKSGRQRYVTSDYYVKEDFVKNFSSYPPDQFRMRVLDGTTLDIVIHPFMSVGKKDYEPFTNGPSPNPDFPQEIKSVDSFEVVRTGKNLFDKAKVSNGSIDSATGEITNQIPYVSSDYILVNQGLTYVRVNKGALYGQAYYLYDKDKKYLGTTDGFKQGNPFTIDNPKVRYVRFSLNTEVVDFNNYIFAIGNHVIPYEPYHEESRTITPPRAMNIFDDTSSSKIYFDKLNVETGNYEYISKSASYNGSSWVDWSSATKNGMSCFLVDFGGNYSLEPRSVMAYCDKLIARGTTIRDTGWRGAMRISVFIPQSIVALKDTNGFKAWLASNDVSITCIDDHTTEEPISSEDLAFLRSLRDIPSTDNIFVTDNHGRDCSWVCQYIRKLDEV